MFATRPPLFRHLEYRKISGFSSGTVIAVTHYMSQTRRVVPGATYFITRRTVGRTHLLRPDQQLIQLFLYVLAFCAQRFGIEVVAVVLMSTHEHLVIRDPLGKIPDFLRELHRLVALGVKILRKWDGTVWDPEKTSVVELCTPRAIIEKLGYLIANPVAAGLVPHAHEWPGLKTLPSDLGVAQWTVKRPDIYFDADNPIWPEEATLRLVLPDIGIGDERIRLRVAAELETLEHQGRAVAKAKGLRALSAEQILRLSAYDQATSDEPIRKRNPVFAVGRGQREAFLKAAQALRGFRKGYREALRQWREGVRDVLFPPETWLMRVLHNVRVAPA